MITVDEIVRYFGSRAAAIRELDVTYQTLKNWERDGVPRLVRLAVQTLSHGKLVELRAEKKRR